MMFAENTNHEENSRNTWFVMANQHFMPLPEDTKTTTNDLTALATSEPSYLPIPYDPWHQSYDLDLGLSLMSLNENRHDTVLRPNVYQPASQHEGTILPLFYATTYEEPEFSPSQSPAPPFVAAPFAPLTGSMGPAPYHDAVPRYTHRPDPQFTGEHRDESPSPGLQQQKGKRTASLKKKLNPKFRCLHPGCSENPGEARALNRHIWSAHREWAQENKVFRCEEMACPFPGCPRRGRKDNIMRHFRTKHKQD
ncbi:hypothetical protein QBC40DRAFT_108385 [Triangularia verruculosa]|uniref:Uncharacterized protein n=1 Tax=Triangularia verruculosa TaxID=2587418 RepID=A0AAN6XCM5_9PEZI|nr:hypothetical protein QBC40DRAFT_108385 [Triangularia verruculosa]